MSNWLVKGRPPPNQSYTLKGWRPGVGIIGEFCPISGARRVHKGGYMAKVKVVVTVVVLMASFLFLVGLIPTEVGVMDSGWKEFFREDGAVYSYHVDTVQRPFRGVVRVWVRCVEEITLYELRDDFLVRRLEDPAGNTIEEKFYNVRPDTFGVPLAKTLFRR